VDGVLSGGARVLAGLSACVLMVAALVVLARANLITTHVRQARLRRATWVIATLLAVNTVGNLAGTHPFERWVMGSISLIAMILTAVVARTATLDHEERS
jgi:hypothetical protein